MSTASTHRRMQKVLRQRGYPRPMLERNEWWPLNGTWDFAIDHEGYRTRPEQVQWPMKIRVPYAPETPASGVNDNSYYRVVWYRRTFTAPQLPEDKRLILHFGAVDYNASVWVNGQHVVSHEGGYTPFHADVTDALVDAPEQTLVVRAEDDPHELAKPRGKQDWHPKPHSIWYPRTTGIWQTVWMERVPRSHIARVVWTPYLERWQIHLKAQVADQRESLRLRVRLRVGERIIADDSYLVIAGEVVRSIAFSDPGIDDFRNELLWSPSTPTLIDADLELRNMSGQVVDAVRSYAALRSIGIQGDRFVLNGRPHYLRLVLDQGYYPDSGLTAPDDEAIKRDIELVKAMGFNGVRCHQKVPDPRFLYWADVYGLLVWDEMPSAYRFTRRSVQSLIRQWQEVMERDISHPCIVVWVPFNESWGVPDLPDSPAQRHCVQALYHLTKTLDPTRPVIGNDGWESVATDIIGIHDYDEDPDRIRKRYGEQLEQLFKRERPGGRLIMLEHNGHVGQPIMLTEFGGIALSRDRKQTWGYSRADDVRDFTERYTALVSAVRSISMLTGFCYTQFTDTYQEANGLLYADRTPKIPIKDIRAATVGPYAEREQAHEQLWRERLMQMQWHQYSVPDQDHRTESP